jgi:cell division protein FtsW
MSRTRVRRYLDRPHASVQLMLLAGCGLLGFGLLMAASTTIAASNDQGSAIWTQLVRELEFVVVGLPILWLTMRASPRRFRTLAYPFTFVALLALVAVITPGIGVGVYGARRWIDLGPLQLQPSEFAKLAILLWAADLLTRKQHLRMLTEARHVFVPLIPIFVLVCGLVMLEPDLGTTMCFILILLGLLWTLGLPLRYFGAVLLAVGGAVTLLAVMEPYRLKRLLTFVHPFQEHRGAGYQTVEGLYALASGGFFGVGLGNGTSKYEWVPNANTDYVFSVIGEELGLFGCSAVLALFALLAFTGLRITRRSTDPFVRLAAGGATVWICGQALINIGYVTALLPVTGIPLPFISAGGTSLLTTIFVFGMLVSFARHEPAAVAAAQRAAANGTRARVERWLRVPVPKAYAPPRRAAKPKAKAKPETRPRPKPPPQPVKRAQPVRRAQPVKRAQPPARVQRLPAAPRASSTAYRSPTGTQRRRA